jgi:hypothetical protein
LAGQMQYELVMDAYVLSMDCPCQLWDAHGWTGDRHRLNQRKQMSVVEKYAQVVLEKGVMIHFRGALIATEERVPVPNVASASSSSEVPMRTLWWFLAGGTLLQAVKKAAELDPNNQFVKHLKRRGFSRIVKVHPETPMDIAKFLKSGANDFHFGSAFNLCEQLEDCLAIQTAWRAHARANNIVKDECMAKGEGSYEKLYSNFIGAKWYYGDYFQDFQHFCICVWIMTHLKKYGMVTKTLEVLGNKCDFTQIRGKMNSVAMKNIKELAQLFLRAEIEDSWDKDSVEFTWDVLLVLVIPMNASMAKRDAAGRELKPLANYEPGKLAAIMHLMGNAAACRKKSEQKGKPGKGVGSKRTSAEAGIRILPGVGGLPPQSNSEPPCECGIIQAVCGACGVGFLQRKFQQGAGLAAVDEDPDENDDDDDQDDDQDGSAKGKKKKAKKAKTSKSAKKGSKKEEQSESVFMPQQREGRMWMLVDKDPEVSGSASGTATDVGGRVSAPGLSVSGISTGASSGGGIEKILKAREAFFADEAMAVVLNPVEDLDYKSLNILVLHNQLFYCFFFAVHGAGTVFPAPVKMEQEELNAETDLSGFEKELYDLPVIKVAEDFAAGARAPTIWTEMFPLVLKEVFTVHKDLVRGLAVKKGQDLSTLMNAMGLSLDRMGGKRGIGGMLMNKHGREERAREQQEIDETKAASSEFVVLGYFEQAKTRLFMNMSSEALKMNAFLKGNVRRAAALDIARQPGFLNVQAKISELPGDVRATKINFFTGVRNHITTVLTKDYMDFTKGVRILTNREAVMQGIIKQKDMKPTSEIFIKFWGTETPKPVKNLSKDDQKAEDKFYTDKLQKEMEGDGKNPQYIKQQLAAYKKEKADRAEKRLKDLDACQMVSEVSGGIYLCPKEVMTFLELRMRWFQEICESLCSGDQSIVDFDANSLVDRMQKDKVFFKNLVEYDVRIPIDRLPQLWNYLTAEHLGLTTKDTALEARFGVNARLTTTNVVQGAKGQAKGKHKGKHKGTGKTGAPAGNASAGSADAEKKEKAEDAEGEALTEESEAEAEKSGTEKEEKGKSEADDEEKNAEDLISELLGVIKEDPDAEPDVLQQATVPLARHILGLDETMDIAKAFDREKRTEMLENDLNAFSFRYMYARKEETVPVETDDAKAKKGQSEKTEQDGPGGGFASVAGKDEKVKEGNAQAAKEKELAENPIPEQGWTNLHVDAASGDYLVEKCTQDAPVLWYAGKNVATPVVGSIGPVASDGSEEFFIVPGRNPGPAWKMPVADQPSKMKGKYLIFAPVEVTVNMDFKYENHEGSYSDETIKVTFWRLEVAKSQLISLDRVCTISLQGLQ